MVSPNSSNRRSNADFSELEGAIIKCAKCPRLRAYAKAEATRKRPRYSGWDYWARPVPGFGDLDARLLIIGLAPAAAGALRTGRIFTGDASSRFLVKALYTAGFANQAVSESREDDLVYTDCYVTAAVKCAPPGDKPTLQEQRNCAPFLDSELAMLSNLQSVLALGAVAYRAYLAHLKWKGVPVGRLNFSHGDVYRFGGAPTLYASYHPSPRNTNTGVLTQDMLVGVLQRIVSDFAPSKHN